MADGFTPIFTGSGSGHRAGAVPDPVASPADYVLRADATWGAPPAGGYQFGVDGLTIGAGNPSATAAIPFSPTYAAAPAVLCSSSDPEIMASAYGITTGGFVAQLTAATPVVVDTAAVYTYLAM